MTTKRIIKPVHMAASFDKKRGEPTALCTSQPIKQKRETWTLLEGAVNCPECRKALRTTRVAS